MKGKIQRPLKDNPSHLIERLINNANQKINTIKTETIARQKINQIEGSYPHQNNHGRRDLYTKQRQVNGCITKNKELSTKIHMNSLALPFLNFLKSGSSSP
jgi:hypothetical protein